jgi:copper resistance protein C
LTSRRIVLVVAALLLVFTATASAHSLLLESSPAAGSVVSAPPEVRLRFNGRVEKRLSHLAVVDERGEARGLVLDAGGPPDRLAAPLPPLPAGRYRLEWHVLSTDGHVVSGGFGFRVGQ